MSVSMSMNLMTDSALLLPQTTIASLIVWIILIPICFIYFLRQRTGLILKKHHFPTVFWAPRFISYTYSHAEDHQKMNSSTITRILPRMRRLDGPYGCYGTVYGINTPVIHMAHPIPARAVLMDTKGNNNNDSKRISLSHTTGASKTPAYNHFHNFSGRGVFTADGDEWKAKRLSVLHCLFRNHSNPASHDITQTAIRAGDRLVGRLLTEHDNKGVFNIVPILQHATLGLIYEYLTHTTLPSNKTVPQYLDSITRIRMILLAQSRSIWFLLPRWCYRLFSTMYQEEESTMLPIREFCRAAFRSARPSSPLRRLSDRPSHGSDRDVLDETITLLFAGQDTGAATLSWTLHLLSLHPDVQERLARELETEAADHDGDVPKLEYLDAVVRESMRLFPVAPFVVRKLQRDIPCGTTSPPSSSSSPSSFVLPKDALACVWIYGLHRNPTIWTEHPSRFDPDRWLDGRLTRLQLDSYMPFCAGPRNCLGQPMAHVWLRILLSKVVTQLRVIDDRLVPGSKVAPESLYRDMQAGFTVLPAGGVQLRVEKR